MIFLFILFFCLPSVVHAGGHFPRPPLYHRFPAAPGGGSFAGDYSDTWHLEAMNVPAAWEISRGAGVMVALLDSGVDSDHPALAGHLALELARNFGDPDDPENIEDGIGHGTAMAGLILQVAPEATIIPLKINSGSSASFTNEALISALDYVLQLQERYPRIRVVNLSVVVDEPDGSDMISSKLDELAARGMMAVVAAGNQGKSAVAFPANLSSTLAVAAMDVDEELPFYSNYGSALTFVAPGELISAPNPGGGYAYTSGTSPATALVSGSLALLAAELGDSNGVLWALLAGSRDLAEPGHGARSGFGYPDVGAAAREAEGAAIYTLPVSLVLQPGDERVISISPAAAEIHPPANAPYRIAGRDRGQVTVTGLRPGQSHLEIEWQGGRRSLPVVVRASGGDSCRLENLIYPRYGGQVEGEGLWGFCTVQCLAPQKTDGCWWTTSWDEGGYDFYCLSGWRDICLKPGMSTGILFSGTPITALVPGIYEMGLSFTDGDSSAGGGRSFYVNLYSNF